MSGFVWAVRNNVTTTVIVPSGTLVTDAVTVELTAILANNFGWTLSSGMLVAPFAGTFHGYYNLTVILSAGPAAIVSLSSSLTNNGASIMGTEFTITLPSGPDRILIGGSFIITVAAGDVIGIIALANQTGFRVPLPGGVFLPTDSVVAEITMHRV